MFKTNKKIRRVIWNHAGVFTCDFEYKKIAKKMLLLNLNMHLAAGKEFIY